jgi:hypothetical protein
MNRLTIISCFTLICIFSFSSHATVVKKCTLDSSWSQMPSGDMFAGHKTHEYDANGNEIKLSSYDTNGVLKSYTEWQYNTKNNPVKMVMYQKSGTSFIETTRSSIHYNNNDQISVDSVWFKGTLLHVTRYYYFADNKNARDSVFNADGSLSGYDVFEYQTNQYTTTSYDSLGQNQGKGISETNNDGKIIKFTWYDKDDIETSHSDYTYDNNGNNITIKSYDANGDELSSTINEYDVDNYLTISTVTVTITGLITFATVTKYYYSEINGIRYFSPHNISNQSIKMNGGVNGKLYSIQGKLLYNSIKYSSLTQDRSIPRGLYLFRYTELENVLSFPVIVK